MHDYDELFESHLRIEREDADVESEIAARLKLAASQTVGDLELARENREDHNHAQEIAYRIKRTKLHIEAIRPMEMFWMQPSHSARPLTLEYD